MAIQGAFLTEFIDMFDIYLPVVVLAPVLDFFQPAHLDPGTAAILASLVFITTLLGRPVGALLFGMAADQIGRRRATIYSVAGFSVITLMIALLPGYQSIGVASYQAWLAPPSSTGWRRADIGLPRVRPGHVRPEELGAACNLVSTRRAIL